MDAESAQGSRRSLAAWVIAIVGMAVLVLHARAYLPFISDDALISLRYAQRLLAGDGLTWTDGERVEGYSNLLWVLSCAGGGVLGLDLIDAARGLGLLCSCAALLAIARAGRMAGPAGALPGAFGALAFAASGTVAVWVVGGLEQPLVCALLAWAIVTSYPLAERGGRALLPGALLALLCWTRPDGFLFTPALAAGLLLARGRGALRGAFGDAVRLAVLPVLAVLGQLAFRLAYYGEWVPNTAHGKLAFTANRLGEGLAYVGAGLLFAAPLILPALALAVTHARKEQGLRRRLPLILVPMLAWAAYVAAIGGDIFPGRRHMAPIVVGAALLAVEGARGLVRSGRVPTRAAWGGAAVLVAGFFTCQWQDPQNARAKTERWEWDGEVVGRLLKTAFGAARPLLAADAAGTLPYFSELPALDMLGLSDRYLAQHPPPDLGEGWLGHELGDGRYVLEREPDLVVFSGPAGGPPQRFKSGLEMFRDPRFAERYRLVGFEGDDPYLFRSGIFVRAEGGRIGIVREPNRVRVPGYLLSANVMRGSFAKLDAEGRIGTHVLPGVSAGIRAFPLAAGRWRVRVQHSGGPIRTQVRSAATGAVLAEGADVLELELPGSGSQAIDVELRALSEQDAHVRALVFRRSE